MEIETGDIHTKEADDRGRLYLGTEYANKHVTVAVAVVDVEADSPDEDELAAAYRDAAESTREVATDWEHASDEAWDSLGPGPRIESTDEDE